LLYNSCLELSRKLRWAGHVALMQEKRNYSRELVLKPEENKF
jgi:hypothetical protein